MLSTDAIGRMHFIVAQRQRNHRTYETELISRFFCRASSLVRTRRILNTTSIQLARNLLAQAAEQFTIVFQADQSRLPALYNAASVYILLGDRLEVAAQQFQAYNSACAAFTVLLPLLPHPSELPPLYAFNTCASPSILRCRSMKANFLTHYRQPRGR